MGYLGYRPPCGDRVDLALVSVKSLELFSVASGVMIRRDITRTTWSGRHHQWKAR